MPMQHNSTIESVKTQNKILEEMSNYFAINKFKPRNKESIAKLEEYLYSLFSIRAKEMGYKPILSKNGEISNEDSSISLIFDKKPYVFRRIYRGQYEVTLGNKEGVFYKKNPSVTITEKYFEEIKDIGDIYQIVEILYHELEHAEQEKIWMSQESSKEALSYATYCMVRSFCGERNYNKYYNEVPQEMDAYSNFYLGERLHAKNLFGGISLSEQNANYYYQKFKQSNPLIMDKYEEMLESEIHKKNNSKKMEHLKKYMEEIPILKKKYIVDSNGQLRAKSSIELVSAMKKELYEIENDEEKSEYDKREPIKNCKEMYFELIYNAIQRENLSGKELQDLEDIYGEKTSLYGDMSAYFLAELNKCKKYAELGDRYGKEVFGEKKVRNYFQKEMELIEEYYGKKLSRLDTYRKKQEIIQKQGQQEEQNYNFDNSDNTQSKDLIDPKKVKQDTIIAGINFSEINRKIKEIKDYFFNIIKSEKEDKNR